MAQPPTRPVMARELTRSVPFVTPIIYVGALAIGGTSLAEFDTLEGFADPDLFNSTLAYPGTNAPKLHAVGPWLDAVVYSGGACTLLVEYAVDRGASYRAVAPATAIPGTVLTNISGLRITGRFVRVTLTNTSGAPANVEFGVYVRSA